MNALKHGAHSEHVHKRYGDHRYREAKELRSIIQELVTDLGGQEALTAAQTLLLDNIRSKLIVVLQISKYVQSQESIITDGGEPLPCLGRNYTTYAESLRRDLETLFAIRRKPARQSYEKAMKLLAEGNHD